MVEINREFLLKKYEKDNLMNLTSIKLGKNEIRKIDASTFIGLTKLEELSLSENDIEEINPKLFDSLSNLKKLFLNNNKLKRIDSNTFKGLNNLQLLRLDNNEIEEIDVRSFESLSSLKELYMYNNKLKRIDSNAFKELINLEKISLYENEIEVIDIKLFQSLPNLKKLYLYNNKLKILDSNAFKGLTKLEKLYIYNNKFKKIYSNTFKGLKNLQLLRLDNNEIEKVDAGLFESLPNLKELYLYNNKLKTIDSNEFKQLTKLEKLSLYENEIEEIDVKLFESLSNLKKLYLHKNKLKRIDFNTFKQLKKLEKLSLDSNEIQEIDVRLFESLLDLKELFLFNNKLKIINNNTFKKLTNLRILLLQNNEIEVIDTGSFESLSNLEVLFLYNNKLKEINRRIFEPLKSAKVISLYGNDLKALSFNNLSEFKISIGNGDFWDIESDIKKIEFQTNNWNEFLLQFPQSQFTSLFKRDPLIGQSMHRRYKVKDVLGEGSFGKVYLVQDQNDSNNLEKAIKTMKKGVKSNEQAQEHNNEVEVIKSIKHDNIIQYYEHFDETILGSQYFCFVYELCENGDLKKQIDRARTSGKNFPESRILRWICEATSGLKYLHSENIIHRDIKPANILLSKYNVIKLADFGLSKYTESSMASSLVGSRAYMSPELIKCFVDEEGAYTKKTDIWSLGCVLYELINLKIAFPTGVKIRSPLPDFGTSRFARFLISMLEIKEERRINARDLYEMLSAERAAMEEELS